MFSFIKYCFITFFLSISTAFYLLCFTPNGFLYDLNFIAEKLPGKLSIQKVSGTLFTGFTLENISYESEDFDVAIKTLKIDWLPEMLLQKKVVIEKIFMEDANLSLHSNNDHTISIDALNWLRFITFKHIVIHDVAVKKEKLSLYLKGEMTDHWDVKWKIFIPELHDIFTETQGLLQSEGNIQGPRDTPNLHATLHSKNLRFNNHQIGILDGQTDISIKPFAASSIQLSLKDITFHEQYFKTLKLAVNGNIFYEKESLVSNFSIKTGYQNELDAKINLPNFTGFTNSQQNIVGQIHFNVAHFEILQSLFSEIKHPRGLLKGEINLNGTFSKPIIEGKFLLQEGQFKIPTLGVTPSHIQIEGKIDPSSLIFLQGNFQSGTGKGSLQGKIDLKDEDITALFDIQGQHLLLVNLAEYTVNAASDVQLKVTNSTLEMKGKITLEDTDIMPKNFDDTETLPDEIFFINEEDSASNFNIETAFDIHLNLGNRIQVNYDNLQATLSGNLHITKNFNTQAIADGELYTLTGKYAAYGQKLNISTGRLIFKGNTLLNPGLSIEATKSVRRVVASNPNDLSTNTPSQSIYTGTERIIVGIRIQGTVEHPQITLFSQPADLNQGDILSYLMLGYPQTNATGYQGGAILGMLTSLYPGGRLSNLTEKLENKLGLSELNVGSIQSFNPISKKIESSTALIVGKQITNKLSIHYSVGVFDPVSILNLRYQLDNHWAVQSETSTIDNGADLVYIFERN